METEGYGIVLMLCVLLMIALVAALIIFFQVYRANIQKIEKEKQFAIFRVAVEAEEKHKAKIARDLHDEAIHKLTLLKQELKIQNVQNYRVNEILSESITSIKRIALDLVPITLIRQGVINTLESLAILITKQNERIVEVRNETTFEAGLPFTSTEEVNIYRVCLEIFNNLMKHTGFTYLNVLLENTSNNFIIKFTHNGTGVSDAQMQQFRETAVGLGLRSIEARLMILNATIHYNQHGDFSSVELTIPFKL